MSSRLRQPACSERDVAQVLVCRLLDQQRASAGVENVAGGERFIALIPGDVIQKSIEAAGWIAGINRNGLRRSIR